MIPSSTSEARKRRDAKATPEPLVFPEPIILTTMERVSQVGSGQVALIESTNLADVYWGDWNGPGLIDSDIVLWRPTPERTVTIELDEDVVRRYRDTEAMLSDVAAVRAACRAALDGER